MLFELLEMAYSLKATLEGLRRFPAGSIDGIYERYAIFGFAGALMARWRRVPWVLEVNYTCESPLVRPRSRLFKPLARWVDRRLFRAANHIFAVSSFLKRQLVEDFGVDERRISITPNAADPAVFDPAAVGTLGDSLPDGPIIGFVGGFYPWHGVDLLLEAFLRIVERHPQARLLLIGDGPMRKDLQQRVSQLGLSEQVLMPGKVAHSELAPYVNRFDIGVMPDSNLYGSPMKIFEYMAMAVPVVVPDYDPLTDVVDDGVQGRIFKRHDVADLSRCLDQLLGDAQARLRMGARARQAIVDTHNWMNNAKAAIEGLRTGTT
jgi:glycosyltransferase involved in cell wall biosynthesis